MIKTIKPSLEEGKNFGMSHPNGVLVPAYGRFGFCAHLWASDFLFSAAKINYIFETAKRLVIYLVTYT